MELFIKHGNLHTTIWMKDTFDIPLHVGHFDDAVDYDKLSIIKWLYKITVHIVRTIPGTRSHVSLDESTWLSFSIINVIIK